MANFFFELYLYDYNEDLIDVPILIENVPSDSGGYPNTEPDKNQWILVRRFFIYDTVSGIPQNEYPDGKPVVVRYPKMMTLEVSLDMNNDEMIHVPYLRVAYRERTSTYIEQTESEALIEFGTYYSSSTVEWWKTAEAIFYVLVVVLVIILVIKACVYI